MMNTFLSQSTRIIGEIQRAHRAIARQLSVFSRLLLLYSAFSVIHSVLMVLDRKNIYYCFRKVIFRLSPVYFVRLTAEPLNSFLKWSSVSPSHSALVIVSSSGIGSNSGT